MESFGAFDRAKPAARLLAGLLLCAAVLAPATANTAPRTKAKPQVTTESETAAYRVKSNALPDLTPPTLDVSRFAFTAPGRVSGARVATVERGFRFTPAGASDRRAIAVGVTSRVITASAAPTGSAAVRAANAASAADFGMMPSSYNVDLSVGWLGFAVNGGISRVDQGLALGRRDGVDVGLSYRGSRWRTALMATAERGGPLLIDRRKPEERYSFEATGAYLLSPGVAVTGGVRYRLTPVNPTLLDPDREDRAVFVGGALAF